VAEVPGRDVGGAGVDGLVLAGGVEPQRSGPVGADVDGARHRVLVDAPAAGGAGQADRAGDLPGEHVGGREDARIVLAAGRHRPDHVASVIVDPRLRRVEARALGSLTTEIYVLCTEQDIIHHGRSDRVDVDTYPSRAVGRGR